MPSLNERGEDIILFANFFLDHANRDLGNIIGFTPSAITELKEYIWLGNLRQLNNVVKRATLLTKGDYITAEDLDLEPADSNEKEKQHSFALYDESDEKQRIIDALKQALNNKTKAAQLQGCIF